MTTDDLFRSLTDRELRQIAIAARQEQNRRRLARTKAALKPDADLEMAKGRHDRKYPGDEPLVERP
jgi:hypothetical protein